MSLKKPHDIHHSYADMCHVCNRPLDANDNAVMHDGYVRTTKTEYSSYGTIGLHVECATILSMRLIADVMKQGRGENEPRVVDSLGKIRKAYQEEI